MTIDDLLNLFSDCKIDSHEEFRLFFVDENSQQIEIVADSITRFADGSVDVNFVESV